MTEPLFDKIAIIGLGLISSSIARAARAQGAVRSIVATSRSPRVRPSPDFRVRKYLSSIWRRRISTLSSGKVR